MRKQLPQGLTQSQSVRLNTNVGQVKMRFAFQEQKEGHKRVASKNQEKDHTRHGM